jgi:tRNA(Ile)-lysidine synthase
LDSQEDEREVCRLCKEFSIPCRVLRVRRFKDKVKKQKKSIQELAREIRYSFFLKLVQKEKAWGVAVAHHLEDQAETVLDRLLRGSGSRGLSGLRPVQAFSFMAGTLKVWRPFLAFSKNQIQDRLEKQGISWREDLSNREKKYRRNQIRHEIIPFLRRWNPNLTKVLAHIGEINATEDMLFDDFLGSIEKKVKSIWKGHTYSCDAVRFNKVPLALQRRWVRFVAEKLTPKARGLSFDRIEEVLRLWAAREKGPRDLGFGLVAGRNQNQAFLSRKRD